MNKDTRKIMSNQESVFDKLARESRENSVVEESMKKQQERISELSEQVAMMPLYNIVSEFVMFSIMPMLLEISKSRIDHGKPNEPAGATIAGNLIHQVALQRFYLENQLKEKQNADNNCNSDK